MQCATWQCEVGVKERNLLEFASDILSTLNQEEKLELLESMVIAAFECEGACTRILTEFLEECHFQRIVTSTTKTEGRA